MKNWENNDKGQVVVNFGYLTCYCFADDPYYFSPVLAKLAYWDKESKKAVFNDGHGHYATSRRSFRSEAEIKRLARS